MTGRSNQEFQTKALLGHHCAHEGRMTKPEACRNPGTSIRGGLGNWLRRNVLPVRSNGSWSSPKWSTLEQNPTDLNREGFPSGANSDSDCVLGKEASTHGQAFVGGCADQGGPSG